MSDDTTPDLIAQTPGQVPDVEPESLAPLLELDLVDLVGGLDALTDVELAELRTLEEQGENRPTVVEAINAEQLRRAEGAPPDVQPSTAEPIGDNTNYARMHAHEIDPAKLERPVLTLDGWLLPRPAAKPEA